MVYVPNAFKPDTQQQHQQQQQRPSGNPPYSSNAPPATAVPTVHAVPYPQSNSQPQWNAGQAATAPHNPSYAPSAPVAAETRPSSPPLPDFAQALDNPSPPRPASLKVPAGSSNDANATNGSRFPFSQHIPQQLQQHLPQQYQPQHSQQYNQQYQQYSAGPPNKYNDPTITMNPTQATGQSAAATPVIQPSSSVTYNGGPTNGVISEGNPVQCHKLDYEIKGHEMQLVEVVLDPQETVIAEAGAMMYLEDNIDFKAKFGDGSNPSQGFFGKIFAAGGRLLTGESLFMTHFTNKGHVPARVAFAAPFPGNLIPVNMANIGGTLICQKDSFVCAAFGTKLSIHFNKRLGSGLFGGEGFVLQKLKGDGMAFIHAGGTIIKKELHGERIRLDTGCLVAFTEGIQFDIQFVPGLKSILFGGEGLFLATLRGSGTVWMQSLPFSRMADRILQHAPSAGGRRQGEGNALTGQIGDVLDGDGFGFNF